MTKIILLLISLVCIINASFIDWDEYLLKFPNIQLYTDSKYHFMENIKFIHQHMIKTNNFNLGITQFTHLSNLQFNKRVYNLTTSEERNELYSTYNLSLPTTKNWVDEGAVTPIKNQGQCGSCWSFSTTGSMEGAWFLKTKKLVSLSEQQFVDCSKLNMGCNGGLYDRAFKYAEKNFICSEDEYIYTAKDETCKKCTGIISKLSSYVDIPKGNEQELQKALMINPISVAIEADGKEFQLYKSGVMDFNCGTTLDHAVLLVGFGTENNIDYWLLKNSWDTTWGENGYFKLKRGVNMCGLADSASYPVF